MNRHSQLHGLAPSERPSFIRQTLRALLSCLGLKSAYLVISSAGVLIVAFLVGLLWVLHYDEVERSDRMSTEIKGLEESFQNMAIAAQSPKSVQYSAANPADLLATPELGSPKAQLEEHVNRVNQQTARFDQIQIMQDRRARI